MPSRVRKNKTPRAGPAKNMEMFEGQLDLLGQGGPYEYVKTMMLPEFCEPQRVPDTEMSTSAIFTAPQVIEDLPFSDAWDPALGLTGAPIGTTGETTVILFPGTVGTIWHTHGVQATAPDPLGVTTLVASQVTGRTADIGITSWCAHAFRFAQVGLCPRQRSNGVPTYELTVDSNGSGSNIRVGVSLDPQYTGTATLRFAYRTTASAFLSALFPIPLVAGKGSADINLALLGIVPGVPIISFSFGIETTAGAIPPGAEFSIELTDMNDLFAPARSATSYTIRHLDQLANLQLTSMERPAALAGLLTYMGSTLADGGNITFARLPMGMNMSLAPNGDYFGFLSSLPVYTGDFALRKGAYCYWAPDSIQEYHYKPYGDYACDLLVERSTLVANFRRDDVNQTVRLKVNLNVETQTRSAQYPSLVADYSPNFPRALQLLKQFPSTTENPEHEGFFKRIWSKVRNFVSHPANWVKVLTGGAGLLSKII